MLSGMGEWRGTLSFLASAPSSSCGCTGNTEQSPAACSCLPPASSPARSVLPAARSGDCFASFWVARCSAEALDEFSEQPGLLFFFSSWNSLFSGAVQQAFNPVVRNSVQAQAVSATGRWHAGAFVLKTCSRTQLNKLLELVSRAATIELQVSG